MKYSLLSVTLPIFFSAITDKLIIEVFIKEKKTSRQEWLGRTFPEIKKYDRTEIFL